MKLLFTFFVPSGGIETLNRLRYHALGAAGIEAHALYLWPGAGQQNMSGIPHFVTNNDSEIKNVLEAGQYDAVVVICDHLMLQRLYGLGYRGPMLYEAQGLGTREQAASTLAFASMFIRMYARGVISPPTSHLMELFQQHLSDFPRFYVQNMIDTQQFTHQSAPWLNPTGAPILGWIGRLENNKNWQLYLRIAAELAAERPDILLWMFEDATISEPGEREKFYALVHELNLGSRLVIRSNIPHNHMPYYLSAIGDSGGMVLSTSYAEGFGYAVGEAMSCRCPVLSTDSDGVRCFIEHNRTGKFFYSRSIEEAVTEAKEYLYSRPLANLISLQAQQHIQTHFSLARYAADIRNVMAAIGVHA
ncbi:glycosyltransferase family 4 protein [Paenibacillus sacheonensis]|uniref:Glycosyltransferase n=1 Tax=Paenibacillus sacheonensis TaxID=742054 RepID=A0A7X5C3V7_9BACL|nr:glycosyltransferase family 4 protein [Paenibacillus sacheonensis]MBM7569256.1 glycosyltransferase involved in cell wall biosynthesis [Paenibacillus sacheonensis]NBC71734.1 glycosyltransferase [Paenibacillus sacheonensis]